MERLLHCVVPSTWSPSRTELLAFCLFPFVGDLAFRKACGQSLRRDRHSITRAPITPTQSAPVAPPAPSTGGVIGIAASLAGIPYVYGGTTTAGFDCSGYTQYVFAQMGITLPRTAQDQQQAVTAVSNPQPGDLVFFGVPAYHVGIYAGNGMMWDSPHTGAAVALRAVWSSSPTYGRP
jgi:cell wall-associated NlpC family hydrolase